MGRIWVAVITVLVLVALAAGTVFFVTVGSSMVSNGLANLASRSGPGVALTLYRWSVSANPYDAAHRLALYELYLRQGPCRWRNLGAPGDSAYQQRGVQCCQPLCDDDARTAARCHHGRQDRRRVGTAHELMKV